MKPLLTPPPDAASSPKRVIQGQDNDVSCQAKPADNNTDASSKTQDSVDPGLIARQSGAILLLKRKDLSHLLVHEIKEHSPTDDSERMLSLI